MLQVVVGMHIVTSSVKVEQKAIRLMCLGVFHSWRVNCVNAPPGDFVGTNFHGTQSKFSTNFKSVENNVLMQPMINETYPYMVLLQCRVQCGRRRCVRKKKRRTTIDKRKRRQVKQTSREQAKKKQNSKGSRDKESSAHKGADSEAEDSEAEDSEAEGSEAEDSEAGDSSGFEGRDEGGDTSESDSDLYEVEAILDKRVNWETCTFEYLISWFGYDDEYNTWEPATSLPDPDDAALLEEYDIDMDYSSLFRLEAEMERAMKVRVHYSISSS